MSKTLLFVLLTVSAVGGAAIDRITVNVHASCTPQATGDIAPMSDEGLHRFLAKPALPVTGGARF